MFIVRAPWQEGICEHCSHPPLRGPGTEQYKQKDTREAAAKLSREPASLVSQTNVKQMLLLQLLLLHALGMRVFEPPHRAKLSAYVFLACQTLQSCWEPVCAASAASRPRRGAWLRFTSGGSLHRVSRVTEMSPACSPLLGSTAKCHMPPVSTET